jgi:hypothetical protein
VHGEDATMRSFAAQLDNSLVEMPKPNEELEL